MRRTSLLATVTLALAALVAPVATAQAAPGRTLKPRAYHVTAQASTSDITVGEGDGVVRVTGSVTPRARGSKVFLQQRKAGKSAWRTVGRSALKRDGTYTLTDRPEVGRWDYRVLKRRSEGRRQGTSGVLEVGVYAWQKLAQRPRGTFENIAVSSTAVVNGQTFLFSFQPFTRGAASFVEYPLKGLCSDLRTTYAMHDSAVAGSSSRIVLALDGATAVDQTLVKGQVVPSTTDLTGTSTLRYDLFSTADPASYPAVLVPEVRCTK